MKQPNKYINGQKQMYWTENHHQAPSCSLRLVMFSKELNFHLCSQSCIDRVALPCLCAVRTIWPSYAVVPAEYTCAAASVLIQPSTWTHEGLIHFTSIKAHLPMKRRNEQQNVKTDLQKRCKTSPNLIFTNFAIWYFPPSPLSLISA